jgi:fatty-acid peroxygenase
VSDIPRDDALDGTLGFLREGYSYISSRCGELGSDLFRTRLMLASVTCMMGAEAAGIFYGGGRFTRAGAMPPSVLHLLQDKGSVQTMDGPAHRCRKQMFMAMMTPEKIEQLVSLFRTEWQAALVRWQGSRVVLHDEMCGILTRAGASWAGVPIGPDDVEARTHELAEMIEQAGSFGPANWWAQHLRNRSESWWQEAVARVRRGEIEAAADSAVGLIVRHRDLDGRPLDDAVAAVELLNVIRPIVAVARFVTFAAHALHRHPEWRDRFAGGNETDIEPFVQEVRRFYPFFPVIGGKVLEAFTWCDHAFEPGDWVLLDLYGTNHDARYWGDPETFRPERFRGRASDANAFVPQGGGSYEDGHRCPGEWITIALLKEAVRQLARETWYDVPAQDLTVALDRVPALPASGFVIQGAHILAA